MKVDFYVMDDAGRMQALRELCLLLEPFYAAKQPVYLQVASSHDAEQLDKLLWTYRDDSFLAHQIVSTTNLGKALIEIGTQDETPEGNNAVLVNLTTTIPGSYQQYSRVIEIVYSDPAVQQAARDRFRCYREQGSELNTHKMKVNLA
jgi:DNA polymerase-3 subunit chi